MKSKKVSNKTKITKNNEEEIRIKKKKKQPKEKYKNNWANLIEKE